MTSPPFPPSPPLGPPHGSYFSRRKLTHPRPPSPAAALTTHSSINITVHGAQSPPLAKGSLSQRAVDPSVHLPRRLVDHLRYPPVRPAARRLTRRGLDRQPLKPPKHPPRILGRKARSTGLHPARDRSLFVRPQRVLPPVVEPGRHRLARLKLSRRCHHVPAQIPLGRWDLLARALHRHRSRLLFETESRLILKKIGQAAPPREAPHSPPCAPPPASTGACPPVRYCTAILMPRRR